MCFVIFRIFSKKRYNLEEARQNHKRDSRRARRLQKRQRDKKIKNMILSQQRGEPAEFLGEL